MPACVEERKRKRPTQIIESDSEEDVQDVEYKPEYSTNPASATRKQQSTPVKGEVLKRPKLPFVLKSSARAAPENRVPSKVEVEISKLAKQLSSQSKDIAELHKLLDTKTNCLAQAAHQIANLFTEINDLRDQINQKHNELDNVTLHGMQEKMVQMEKNHSSSTERQEDRLAQMSAHLLAEQDQVKRLKAAKDRDTRQRVLTLKCLEKSACGWKKQIQNVLDSAKGVLEDNATEPAP